MLYQAHITRGMRVEDNSKKLEFRLAIEKHIDALFSLAVSLTTNASDAEDLLGDAVTNAWAAYSSLEDKRKFRPWIMRILRNCFISGYRKKQVRPIEVVCSNGNNHHNDDEDIFTLLDNMSDDFLVWWGNPEKEFANKLMGEEITDAINRLPENFRIVIILIHIEGFSYDETAEILNIPSGTVRSRMRRGRTLLQKALWELAKESDFKAVSVKEVVYD